MPFIYTALSLNWAPCAHWVHSPLRDKSLSSVLLVAPLVPSVPREWRSRCMGRSSTGVQSDWNLCNGRSEFESDLVAIEVNSIRRFVALLLQSFLVLLCKLRYIGISRLLFVFFKWNDHLSSPLGDSCLVWVRHEIVFNQGTPLSGQNFEVSHE